MRQFELTVKVNITKSLVPVQDKLASKKTSANKSNNSNNNKLKSIKKNVNLSTKLEGNKDIELEYLNRNETNVNIEMIFF